MAEEEKKEYQAKKKPSLTKEQEKAKRPGFSRQEWFRHSKLDGDTWRKPKGIQSKLRRNRKYRPPLVSIGYRGPKDVRGLHPSGFQEVLVHRVKDLEGIDPERHAVRIAHGVGMRKRIDIESKADEMGLRVLNPS